MRFGIASLLLLAAVATGCAPKDAAPSGDTTSSMASTTMAPMLTAEAMAGTWTGTNMAEVGDSVTGRFTVMSTGDAGKVISEGSKDTVSYTTTFSGDSMTAISSAYSDFRAPKGSPKITFKSVGRMVGAKLVGTSTLYMASKPDSVVGRGRWEATKAP